MRSKLSGVGEEIAGFKCDCGMPIVYNGNYFCPVVGTEDDKGGHFVLDETRTAWVEIGYDMYVQLMKQRGEEPESLEETCPPAGESMGVRRETVVPPE